MLEENDAELTCGAAQRTPGNRTAVKARMPRHWHAVARHTHVAVDDAIEQGELFMNIVRELNAQHPNRPG